MKMLRLLLLSFALAAGTWTFAARAAESPVTRSAGTGPILETPATPALDAREELALEAGFRNPPAAARPEIFWDWLHDMVSRMGITHDLEAMKRIGLGGALIMLAVFRG